MISGGYLKIQPSELKMPFELRRQSSCAMQLTNKTDHCIAFKVKTTSPKRYCVRPNVGVIMPRSSCGVTVTMQAPKDMPNDLQCKDKFLIQSVITGDGIAVKDIKPDMFNKAPGKVVEEFKLRVVYITANPPSPVPEEEEETSSTTSTTENEEQTSSLETTNDQHSAATDLPHVSSSLSQDSVTVSPDVSSIILKLTDDKRNAFEEYNKLQQQMELLRQQSRKGRRGFSTVFVVLVSFLGIFIGLLMASLSSHTTLPQS